jgi:hypothetical protein
MEILCKLQSISRLGTKENMRRVIVATVLFFNFCGVWAETSSSAATSPTKVVTDLYRTHNGKTDPLQYPASKKLLGAYFEKGLLSISGQLSLDRTNRGTVSAWLSPFVPGSKAF